MNKLNRNTIFIIAAFIGVLTLLVIKTFLYVKNKGSVRTEKIANKIIVKKDRAITTRYASYNPSPYVLNKPLQMEQLNKIKEDGKISEQVYQSVINNQINR